MDPKIPAVNLKLQYESIRQEIDSAIRQVLDRQSFILGPEVAQLEQAVAQKHGCSYAIGCASGSDALLLSVMALELGPGARVIVPSFTFFATAGSVARAGATPLFADIDPRTFNIAPEAVEDILRREKTNGPVRAIIPVHLYGQCADMDALTKLAKQSGISVVEDAAQGIFAHYRENPAGSMGICGCFSFFPTKNLGAFGDGGMITTSDAALADRLRILRVHGSVKKYIHARIGINSRLDTLQAAILLAKIRHLEEWTELRRKRADFYRAAFAESGLSNPDAIYPTLDRPVVLPYLSPNSDHVYHQFTLRTCRRDDLARHLETKGIGTAVYYPVPLHLQQAFTQLGNQPHACPQSERAAKEVLSIPIYPEITAEQQSRVVEEIKSFYAS